MIRIGILSFALAFSVISASAQTQGVPESTPAPTESQSAAPGGMGSNGVTSDTSGSPIGKSNAHTTGSGSVANPSAADQPLTATGEDLKGPPTRFPANRTPE